MVIDVMARTLSVTLWLGLSAYAAACGKSTDADGPNQAAALPGEAAQVKPAVAPATAEPEVLAPEPETEAAELPRGVSAPAPDARDTALAESPEVASAPNKRGAIGAPPIARGASSTDAARAASGQDVAAKAPTSSKETAAKPAPAKPVAPASSKEVAMTTPAKPAPAKPAPAKSAPPKLAAPPPEPPPPAEVPPVKVEPVAPPAAKVSVVVPHTNNVHVEVPSGLQHWLDEDDRMRPWLSKAVNVADSCYAKVRADNPSASGVIAVKVTMHENARPSGGVSSISGDVKSIVMCATTKLLGVKMPLFTGNEGDTYTVRVRFDP